MTTIHQAPAVVSNSSSQVNIAGLSGGGATGEYRDQIRISMSHDDQQQAASASQQGTGQTTAQSQPTTVTAPGTPSSTMPSYPPASSYVVAKGPFPLLPASSSGLGLAVPAPPSSNSVPEFLYQLTKMLTGGHDDIIEWSNGRIEVHNPHKLQNIVLQKYFRHSKFASFQRQLNYFGFRKLAGKGKMAPCSYVNEAATQDIGSLLHIKRKTSPTTTPKDKAGGKNASASDNKGNAGGKAVDQPVPPSPSKSNGLVCPAGGSSINHARLAPGANSQQAIAQAAVGRGIRHSLGLDTKVIADAQVSSRSAASSGMEGEHFMLPATGVEESLSQLTNNYQSSLAEHRIYTNADSDTASSSNRPSYLDPYPTHGFSFLSRDSSLIDLAMIPTLDDGEEPPGVPGLNFVDFPQPEVNPGLDIDADVEQQDTT